MENVGWIVKKLEIRNPIIFLDVDGVLNSLAYFIQEKGKRHSGYYEICEEYLERLAIIYHRCNAKIVLSSTWRELDDKDDKHGCYEMYQYLLDSLAKYGMEIIDKTPTIRQNRPLEIKTWLENQINENEIVFVSLDDDHTRAEYELYGLADCLVWTRYFCYKIGRAHV